MSELQPGDKVRVVFPIVRGQAMICRQHLPDAVDLAGQIGEVFRVRKGEGHTVAVGFMSIWHEGAPWSDHFTPDELEPA